MVVLVIMTMVMMIVLVMIVVVVVMPVLVIVAVVMIVAVPPVFRLVVERSQGDALAALEVGEPGLGIVRAAAGCAHQSISISLTLISSPASH
jgi:hypothetical protein